MEPTTHATAFMPRRGNTLKITCEAMRLTSLPRGDVSCLHTYNPGNNMITTIQELVAHLKHYPDNTVVTIKDVDDTEFVIVDFQAGTDGLTIVIGEKVEPESDEEEGD